LQLVARHIKLAGKRCAENAEGMMMAYTHGTQRSQPMTGGFAVPIARFNLESVRRRRVLALGIDLVLVSVLAFSIWLVLAIGTLGMALIVLPPLYPATAFFYNGLTVSGRYMGTWGQRLLDLEVRMYDSGTRPPFLNAAAHGVLLYFTAPIAPILLISLIARDKRCLHDMLAGVVVVRRQA
jgi:uncharacterized RDD family membrane protein YckC